MHAALQQLRISLTLHYRNKMALIYSYLFPLIFLLAFWVLYRYEKVVLARHMGELLTVSVLGGACFGLPTTLVSERERGVWRRYRLAPVSTATLVASVVAARYFILVTAGLLQLAVALAVGMPWPQHPFDLWVVFTFVSFAFIGLGLVMAMMADNVPAVQALGQCIFLPMLIIGGIAVPLASLPDWAQHLSQFFPGRYAVEALAGLRRRARTRRDGLSNCSRSSSSALAEPSRAPGCSAGTRSSVSRARSGKAWISVALLSWVVVGTMAEYRAARDHHRAEQYAERADEPAEPGANHIVCSARRQRRPRLTVPSTPTLSDAERKATQPQAAATSIVVRRSGPKTIGLPAVSGECSRTRIGSASGSVIVAGGHACGYRTRSGLRSAAIGSRHRHADRSGGRGARSGHIAIICSTSARCCRPGSPAKWPIPCSASATFCMSRPCPTCSRRRSSASRPMSCSSACKPDIPKDQLIKILYWIALHPTDGDDNAVEELWALKFTNDRRRFAADARARGHLRRSNCSDACSESCPADRRSIESDDFVNWWIGELSLVNCRHCRSAATESIHRSPIQPIRQLREHRTWHARTTSVSRRTNAAPRGDRSTRARVRNTSESWKRCRAESARWSAD